MREKTKNKSIILSFFFLLRSERNCLHTQFHFSWNVKAKLSVTGMIRLYRLQQPLQDVHAGPAVSLVTPGWRHGGSGVERQRVFIHNKDTDLRVCQHNSLPHWKRTRTHALYPLLLHESPTPPKYIPPLNQGEGRYWQAKMREATVPHCL